MCIRDRGKTDIAVPMSVQMVFSFFREKFDGPGKALSGLKGPGPVSYTHLGQWDSCQGRKQPFGRKTAKRTKKCRCLETAI